MAIDKRELSQVWAPVPKRPEPLTLRVRVQLGRWMVADLQRDPEKLRKIVIRRMAGQLADEIAAKCLPFDVESLFNREPVVEMELAINDRGSYEHWLPHERRAGHKEGVTQERARLPYGLEAERYYE